MLFQTGHVCQKPGFSLLPFANNAIQGPESGYSSSSVLICLELGATVKLNIGLVWQVFWWYHCEKINLLITERYH